MSKELISRGLRLTVAHTIMLTLLPFVSLSTGLTEGWASNIPLLVLFLLGPLTAITMLSYGMERFGSMIFLSFMPASAFAQVQFLLPWLNGTSESPLGLRSIIYLVLLAALTITDLYATYIAFSLLRNVHEPSTSGPGA